MNELSHCNYYDLFGLDSDLKPVARLNLQIYEDYYPQGFIFEKHESYSGFNIAKHNNDIVLINQLPKGLISIRNFVSNGQTKSSFLNCTPEKKLYRFAKSQWNLKSLKDGEFQIKAAIEYSQPEYNIARKDNEHIFRKQISKELKPTFTTADDLTHIIDSDLTATTIDRDIEKYILCCSYEYDKRLYTEFDVNSCLIINNPIEFERRLMQSIKEKYPHLEGISNRISYSIHQHLHGSLFTKPDSYKNQYEYRFLWWSPSTPHTVGYENFTDTSTLEKKDPLNICIGNIEDIATLIVL